LVPVPKNAHFQQKPLKSCKGQKKKAKKETKKKKKKKKTDSPLPPSQSPTKADTGGRESWKSESEIAMLTQQ